MRREECRGAWGRRKLGLGEGSGEEGRGRRGDEEGEGEMTGANGWSVKF